MKKYALAFLAGFFALYSFAQTNVGIGTNTPNSNAILELSSTSKGLLLPRVTDTTAITGTIPAGLLIYCNNDNKLYCYQNNKWVGIAAASGSGNFWDLLGNGGTIDGTHFIGTTNDIPLNFRVNNQKAGRISNSAGGVTAFGYQSLNANAGIQNSAFGAEAMFTNNTGNFNTAIGYQSMRNNTGGFENSAMGVGALSNNQTGNYNTAIGVFSLGNNAGHNNTALGVEAAQINTTGYSNTAIGMRAMHNNATGHNNIAAGDSAMYYIINGSGNAAFGSKALLNNGGSSNTAIGAGTLVSNVSGSNNSALGLNADVNTGSLNNATAIGAFARVDISNALVLGSVNGINGATADVFVGIGATAPLARLHIKHNSFPTASLLIEETEDDFTRMEFRNTNANSFWQINANPQTVATNARLEFWSISAGVPTTPFVLTGNGNLTITGTLTQASDARLKKNIVPVKNALEKVMQLKGYTYNWKDPQRDPTLQSGVLAQELQQVLPELVRQDDKGMLSVNYTGIIPVMIEAMKEQQKMIIKLQGEIERLKTK